MFTRRDFLRLSGLVASAATLAACQPVYARLGGSTETGAYPAGGLLPPGEYRKLARLTFGARPSELRRAAEIGLAGWLEEQLAPDLLDDAPLDWRLRGFPILQQTPDDVYNRGERLFDGMDTAAILAEMKALVIVRQVYSRRQLFEQMADFWTDHFNISMDKEDVWYLKPADDRDVIRRHALGSFRALLQASAHSPAMLTYLDNQANLATAPNENYAREVMELHTLGVDGGYTQTDVMELARCFTGWTVKTNWRRGEFEFNPDFHDQGVKTILGEQIEPGGMAEAETVLDRLAAHPATARRLCTKLARRFIRDDPPADIVERAAAAFQQTGGDIRAVLRVILLDGLLSAGDVTPKFKRPLGFVVSAIRQLNAETDGGIGKDQSIHRTLASLGQPPFQWPTPDGPPDTAAAWMGSLMPRWQFAVQLARNEIGGTHFDAGALLAETGADSLETFLAAAAPRLLGAPLGDEAARRLTSALHSAGAGDTPETAQIITAGLLASPAFQWT
jgi:uncharacterized protein (DUF1800 family)